MIRRLNSDFISQVFEKLGPSLFDFIKTNEYRPFHIDLVREFGRQILGSVACEFLYFQLCYCFKKFL